jgi:hypothetical protein
MVRARGGGRRGVTVYAQQKEENSILHVHGMDIRVAVGGNGGPKRNKKEWYERTMKILSRSKEHDVAMLAPEQVGKLVATDCWYRIGIYSWTKYEMVCRMIAPEKISASWVRLRAGFGG